MAGGKGRRRVHALRPRAGLAANSVRSVADKVGVDQVSGNFFRDIARHLGSGQDLSRQ